MMNIQYKDRIRHEMERQNLNESLVAAMSAEKHPHLNIGHQFVRNLLRSNKSAKVDIQKLWAVLDVLGICGDVVSCPVGPHARQISPQLESLIAAGKALAMHVLTNREADSELGAFALEIARLGADVFGDLPPEQVLRIRGLSSEIARRCVEAGSTASMLALHPEHS